MQEHKGVGGIFMDTLFLKIHRKVFEKKKLFFLRSATIFRSVKKTNPIHFHKTCFFFKQEFYANMPLKAFEIPISKWTNLRSGNKAEQTPVKPKKKLIKKIFHKLQVPLKLSCSD